MHDRLRAAALAAFLCCATFAHAQQQVTSGPELDYQPSVIQSTVTDTHGRFQMNFAHDGNHSYYAVVGGLFSDNRVSLRAGSNSGVVIRVK